MNIVILTGRLTADPEMKYTADGSPVANFLLAVQRMYKRDGDRRILPEVFEKGDKSYHPRKLENKLLCE